MSVSFTKSYSNADNHEGSVQMPNGVTVCGGDGEPVIITYQEYRKIIATPSSFGAWCKRVSGGKISAEEGAAALQPSSVASFLAALPAGAGQASEPPEDKTKELQEELEKQKTVTPQPGGKK